jgi:hypothetical protein
VVLAGIVASTGITGLTLGDGIGHLMRRFGAIADNLTACDMITVDGRKVRAIERQNPNLFWTLRGGGGVVAASNSGPTPGSRMSIPKPPPRELAPPGAGSRLSVGGARTRRALGRLGLRHRGRHATGHPAERLHQPRSQRVRARRGAATCAEVRPSTGGSPRSSPSGTRGTCRATTRT